MAFLLLGFYFVLLALLAMFGLHRYYLSYLYYKHQDRRPRDVPAFGDQTVDVLAERGGQLRPGHPRFVAVHVPSLAATVE